MTFDVSRDSLKDQYAEAVTTFKDDMFRVCRSILGNDTDAEDAVGDAVLRGWQSFSALRDAGAVKSWLIKISVNCAYEMQRKNSRLVCSDGIEAFAGQAAESRDFGLWDAVMRLPEEFRAVTVMYYFEDMPTKDIARILKVRNGTVRSRLARARKLLRTVLEEE